MLTQEGIQKDLELVEDQITGIERGQEEVREKMRDLFMNVREDMQGMDEDERRERIDEIRAEMKAVNDEISSAVLSELLPHQVERLKQLMVQAQTRRNGGATSGRLSSVLVEELGIDEEQQEKLKAKAEEVGKKLSEKIKKLQSQAQEEIFSSVLTKEQYAQFKELYGEAYDFDANRSQQQNRWGRGGGGRGGDGARGGRGGDGARGGRGGDGGGRQRGGRGGDNNSSAENDF